MEWITGPGGNEVDIGKFICYLSQRYYCLLNLIWDPK